MLEEAGFRPARERDSRWGNLIEFWKRLESDELPGAHSDGLTSVAVDRDLPPGWTLGSLAAPAATGDEVTADLFTWRRLAPGDRPAPTSFVRLER